MNKKWSYLTTGIFVVLLTLFVGAWWDKGSQFFNEQYGVNPVLLTTIIVVVEVLFNIGIAMMLMGSGLHRLSWKEVWNFDFDRVRFSGKLVYWGFWINRIASAIPSSYVLWVGFEKLPAWVTGLVFLELVGVVLVGFLVQSYIMKREN